MTATRFVRGTEAPFPTVGSILAHDLRDADGRIAIAKGTVLGNDELRVLASLPWSELHVVQKATDELHEFEAGARLAAAAAGSGTVVGMVGAGAWPVEATSRGIVDVREVALQELNGIEGLCVYTLYAGQVVDRGEVIARAKIVPFVLPEGTLQAGERIARGAGGVVAVRPFTGASVGAVVTESLGARAALRFREALNEKVTWFGSTLLDPAFVDSTAQGVADGLTDVLARGARCIALAGARSMDPLDPVFEALRLLGGTMIRHGVPAHPGSLVWLARVQDVPVIGMPACGLFSQATVFDLILPRLLAGESLVAADLAALGHGGFLTRDMAFRFPPYRKARDRGAVE